MATTQERTGYAMICADMRTAEWSRIVAIHPEAAPLEQLAEIHNAEGTHELYRVMTWAEAEQRLDVRLKCSECGSPDLIGPS